MSFAAVLLSLMPALTFAGQGVRFDTILSEGGARIATPSVWVPFGQDAVIEVPGKVRVVAVAQEPNGSHSLVQATIYRFVDGQWVQDWKSAMNANIAMAPSFEKNLEGGVFRVVVMPRAAERPVSSGN